MADDASAITAKGRSLTLTDKVRGETGSLYPLCSRPRDDVTARFEEQRDAVGEAEDIDALRTIRNRGCESWSQTCTDGLGVRVTGLSGSYYRNQRVAERSFAERGRI